MRRARGMTLIEVMVAMLVATVGLLGSLAMVGTIFRSSTFSRRLTEASVLAQSKLEMEQGRRSISPAAGAPANCCAPEPSIDATGAPVANNAGPYSRTTTWVLAGAPPNQRWLVTVAVTWDNGGHTVIVRGERDP